jgi:hypothetical protein
MYSLSGSHGLWRSLVAHLTGGQGVVGSNPASPTTGTHIQILGLSPKREIMFENNDSFSRGVCFAWRHLEGSKAVKSFLNNLGAKDL